LIELTPMLDNNIKVPLYMQLTNYIKREIFTGKIKPNAKLPSKRKLSSHPSKFKYDSTVLIIPGYIIILFKGTTLNFSSIYFFASGRRVV